MDETKPLPKDRVAAVVRTELLQQPVADFHTHLFAPRFGAPLFLSGVDELLTYHYLLAELFRVLPRTELTPEKFYALGKREQADLVWKHLFVARSPVSEACRGTLTTLHALGLDTSPGCLPSVRKFFAEQAADLDRHVDRVMEIAKVSSITMTNEVFDDVERSRWLADPSVGKDPRFRCVLRLDPLLIAPAETAKKLHGWGYGAGDEEARRFLREWIERIGAVYLAVSLPPEFTYPGFGDGDRMLENVILPVCRERGLSFAMMIGARRGVNPALGQAGDGLGRADVRSVTNLCERFPDNRFFVTMLSLENQHELCVAARKFATLTPFGCWWFLNTPSSIEHITRLRVELLGTSFIPQHSDARVLEQLVYKWDHSRRILADVFTEKYEELHDTGWPVTQAAIRDDVRRMFQ